MLFSTPQWIREKNFFFRLSRYQQPLLKHFAAHPGFLQPEERRNEILRLLEGGLEDISVTEKVVGGSVPRGFFPGIEKGIRETAAEGVLAGYPLSDFRATLYDGSFHTVDSNELSFKIAASMALKKGVLDCKPALLEPIMSVEVRVPEEYMGDVNRDLNTRRGRVLGMDTADGMQVVQAHVPQAELFSYATELRSMTRGRGIFTATLDHYEEVPQHLAEKVIEQHRKESEATAAHGGH